MNMSNWSALGVVVEEPKLMKLGEDKVMAKTILCVNAKESCDKNMYLPVVAFNKKAHVLCSLAHKGSYIFAKGTFLTNERITSKQGKTLIALNLKITDFEILVKKPLEINEIDFVQTVQLYDPEIILEEEYDK